MELAFPALDDVQLHAVGDEHDADPAHLVEQCRLTTSADGAKGPLSIVSCPNLAK